MIPWTIITRFGDLSIMAPTALLIMGWLALAGKRRLALLWAALFVAGMGIATATKIAFIGWGIGIRTLDFTGISGHALRAATVMPVLCYLILQGTARTERFFGVALGLLFAALVGLSRLAVHAHSVSEVAAGLLLGGVIGLYFIRHAGPLQTHVPGRIRIACTLALLLVAPHAQPAPTQRWLTKATLYISGHGKPFTRANWREAKLQGPFQLADATRRIPVRRHNA